MQTRVSTKGQVVLPAPLRRRLGIRTGDPLDASVEAGSIVLRPHRKPRHQPRIIQDPVLGTPVLSFGPDAPVLTSREVKEILADFP
jgi:AbrB family looped-hinge helix DNA binding protein